MKLSDEQRRIIQHTHGPALVVAGPGTGKTTTLLHRVNYLIHQQAVTPAHILLLTFSTNTEEDLKARLLQVGRFDGVETRTFHSFGYTLIKQNPALFGYTQAPKYLHQTKKTPKAYGERVHANRITYGDMLLQLTDLIEKKPKCFQRQIRCYQHILVDELQDLNAEQTAILLGLSQSKTLNSMVMVGDCKQLIYSFRGASMAHWQTLSDKPKPTIYPLSVTHRLKKASLGLVNAVGKLIAPNDPPLRAGNCQERRLKPCFKAFDDFDQQAQFIADNIEQLLNQGVPPNQIACLSPRIWNLRRLGMVLERHGLSGELIKQTPARGDSANTKLNPAKALVLLLKLTQAIHLLGPRPRPNSESKQLRNHAKTLKSALRALGVPKRHVTSIAGER